MQQIIGTQTKALCKNMNVQIYLFSLKSTIQYRSPLRKGLFILEGLSHKGCNCLKIVLHPSMLVIYYIGVIVSLNWFVVETVWKRNQSLVFTFKKKCKQLSVETTIEMF